MELFTETMSPRSPRRPGGGRGGLRRGAWCPSTTRTSSSPRRPPSRSPAATDKPVAVLAPVPAAIDHAGSGPAARVRRAGPGVDQVRHRSRCGTCSRRGADAACAGCRHPTQCRPTQAARDRWAARLAEPGATSAARCSACCATTASPPFARPARSTLADRPRRGGGHRIPGRAEDRRGQRIAHKTDVGGVRLGVAGPEELTTGYADLAARLGPRVAVCQLVPPGPELIVGMARDPALGPLIVTGPGGVLADLFPERSVALPPLTISAAASSVSTAPASREGARRGPWQPALRPPRRSPGARSPRSPVLIGEARRPGWRRSTSTR